MRSKGIGKQLLNFVLNGEESINEQNPRAVGFYESMGYTILYDFIAYPNRKMYRLIKTLNK